MRKEVIKTRKERRTVKHARKEKQLNGLELPPAKNATKVTLRGNRYAVLSSKYWVCFVKGTTRKNYGYSLDYIVNGIYCLLKISFIANFKHCSRRTQYIGNWQTNKHAGNFPRYSVSYVKAPRFNLPRGSLNIIQLCYVLNSNLKNLFHSPRRKKYFHQKESRTRW